MAAWTKRTWTERAGTLLNRFTKSSETTTSVILENAPDTITQAGTPFTADAMNNIESGIDSAFKKDYAGEINALTAKTPAAGDVICIEDSGASFAKKKVVAGNASGNVPLSNNTKCEGLYAANAESALRAYGGDYNGTDPLAYISAGKASFGKALFYIGYNASATTAPNLDVDNWLYDVDYDPADDSIYVVARKTNARTDRASWCNKYQGGTWGGWVTLTDANGNPPAAAFDLIIDSNAKLAAWAASGTYARVLIKAGTWTLASGGVDLTARGTKVVEAEPGSLLTFSSSATGLYYTTVPTTPEYNMRNVGVSVAYSSGVGAAFSKCVNLLNCSGTASCTNSGHVSGVAFSYCNNLVNCYGSSNSIGFDNCGLIINSTGIGSNANSTDNGSGFNSCTNLTNCKGMGAGGGTGRGFASCVQITNCRGVGTGASGYGFSDCKKCVNNKALSASTTATYDASYADAGTAAACADTAAGGWNS